MIPAATTAAVREPLSVQNASGMLIVADEVNNQPTIRVVLPGHEMSDRSIEVIFPEHVSAVPHGSTTSRQLYRFSPGSAGQRPLWRKAGPSLEYDRDLAGGVHLFARATLEDDGVRFLYQFTNGSDSSFDMIYAVTDPRLTSIFHDDRLERTYVHHKEGFDLLASETPGRLTLPIREWLPARYRAAYTWPVPDKRVDRPGDGITYYDKSRAVDAPFIATLSADNRWVVASFTRETGNVWSNPQLTCQHVDPQTSLAPRGSAVLEIKMLVIRGTLDDAFRRSVEQRATLK